MWTPLAEFLDALYPRLCRLCGRPAADGFGCGDHAWPVAGPADPGGRARCFRCAAPLGAGLPRGFSCPACRSASPPYWRTVACADYRGGSGVRDWVLALKHGGRCDLAAPLGFRLAECLQAHEEPSCFVPVPLHPLRWVERGYDQASLLARSAGRELGWPVVPALLRQRHTPPQGALDASGRRANVHGAFRLDRLAARRLRGRLPWIVDDVMTSGATVAEAARVLRQAGSERVGVICLARAAGALSSVR